MIPGLLLRNAVAGALAAGAMQASAASGADADFAPLVGAQLLAGQSWPSQAQEPGRPQPPQLLLYGWEERSESLTDGNTAPLFETTKTIVVEARVDARNPAAVSSLPGTPNAAQLAAAIDGVLEQLCFAVKKAVCQYLGLTSRALNNGRPVLKEIKKIDTAGKYSLEGLREAGNAAIAFDIIFGEIFEPLITTPLDDIVVLVNATAGALANSGNTGNGTIGAVSVALGAMPGGYAVLFTSATAFTVTTPDMSSSAPGAVGTPFAALGVGFTVSAGTAPFIAGDGFAVDVDVMAENYITF